MTAIHAHRIPNWRYLTAAINTWAFGTTHPGAHDNWHPLVEFGETPTVAVGVAEVPTALIPVVRRPVAAIAAQAEYAVDELGPWKPEQHPLEPARLYDALTGSTR